ncbi:MAG: histidine phosphatase family protein [Spirosomataceae bacterium]
MYKIVCCFLLALHTLAQTHETPTVIYLVRHAEKVTTDPTAKDPTLIEQGLQRAESLAKKLKQAKLSAIYSTDYQRTKLTATPAANQQQLTIQLYNPKNLQDWVVPFLAQNKGKTVLIVGHSNTVLETIEALGGKRPIPQINDDEYGYFFELVIKEGGNTEVKVSQY